MIGSPGALLIFLAALVVPGMIVLGWSVAAAARASRLRGRARSHPDDRKVDDLG